MVAVTPLLKAPGLVEVNCAEIRSHWLTERGRLVDAVAQQGGVGPVTPAIIPVPRGVVPQFVLLMISACAVCSSFKDSVRILKTKPVIVESCAMTIEFLGKLSFEVPSPKKSPVLIDRSEAK